MIANYQNRVLGPAEVVNYSQCIRSAYPVQAIQTEPFVGFKILCRDLSAFDLGNTGDRLRQLDQFCPYLRGSGCILRETGCSVMNDGLWLISMPVPRSQVQMQLGNVMKVLRIMAANLNVMPTGIFEVSVSGRCTPIEIEGRLSRLDIPPRFQSMIVPSANSPYKIGVCNRINDFYMIFRTMWNMSNSPMAAQNMDECLRENLDILSLKLSNIF